MPIPDDAEGTIYQRGPNGEIPTGMSVRGSNDNVGTAGAGDHVSMYWDGGHRSWDNDGPNGTHRDHSTDHATGKITQHD